MAGALSPSQFRQALQRKASVPAWLFTGPEAVLRDEALDALVSTVLDPSLRDFNLDQASASELEPERLTALCTTLPMLAEQRVVIIRDIEAWRRRTRARAAVLRYLAQPAPETVLVLIQGDEGEKSDAELQKLVKEVRFDPPDADEAAEWLAGRAKALGIAFAPGAAEHLLSVAGTDLGMLRAELSKLEAYAGGTPVALDLVADLVGVRHGETLDDWIAAVLADRTGDAVRLAGPVLGQSGMSGVRMVQVLGTHLLLLGLAADARARKVPAAGLGNIVFSALKAARPFGLGPWGQVVDRVKAASPRWSPMRVEAALREALAADQALKSTAVRDERAVVAELALRLAPPSGQAVA